MKRFALLLLLSSCGGKVAPAHSGPHCQLASESFDGNVVTRDFRCPDGHTIRATSDTLYTRQ